jgi:GNAT superfamily N-acetyltransferase
MIRPPKSSEAGALVALGVATGLFSASEADALLRMTLDDFLSARLGSNHRVVVACDPDDDNPLGWTYFAESDRAPGVWDLWWIGVAPTAQRRGIGQELLDYAETCVRAEGGRVLVIETSTQPKLLGARTFYERNGYLSSGVIADFYAMSEGKQTYFKTFGASAKVPESSRHPMVVRVLAASEEHASAINELLALQFAEHDISLAAPMLHEGTQMLHREPERGGIWIALSGDAPVGVAVTATTWTLEHGGLAVWLDELYVVPSARRRGVGAALLHEVRTDALERGARSLELEVDAEHARAENLYRRSGFTRLRRTRWQLKL